MTELRFFVLACLVASLVGCREQAPSDTTFKNSAAQQEEKVQVQPDALDLTVGLGEISLSAYELKAEQLLSAALPADQLDEGWVRLFDGHTFAGWSIMGNADWQCKDGIIRVTRGEPSFLVTNFDIADYEMKVDFRCAPDTNSGIFLRTAPEPGDVALDCLELNIAPPDNPYPTGSFVKRQKVEVDKLGRQFDPTQWHTFHIRLEGETVTVALDGKPLTEMIDETSSRRGYISLQHNQGIVEFRNILLRPMATKSLKLGEDWQEDWLADEKEGGTLQVQPSPAGLRIVGGLGKVQSKESYGDFWLQAQYSLAKPEVNSGIFFRCLPDSMLDGYECQVNHAIKGGDPLAPADAGAGAIFRRKNARIVVGDGTTPTHLSLLASNNQIVAWINGVLVTEFVDDRPADENPRKGKRIEAGPIALQGHDPTTDATFHQIKIQQLR